MTQPITGVAHLAIATVLLASGSLAEAQTVGSPGASSSPVSGTGSTSGGRAPERRDVSLSLTARYDSNVPRIDDQQLLVARGLTKEDVRFSPALNLTVSKNLGRHQVGLQSTLGYDFYARNTSFNSERILVQPYIYLDLPVCDLTISGEAARRQSELSDIVIVTNDPAIGLKNTETRKRIGGQVVCGGPYGLRPRFDIDHSVGYNSNPVRRVSDFTTTRIQPGLGYSSPGLGEIGVFAVRQDTYLPNQKSPTGQAQGFILRGYGVNYSRNIGTRLKFDGNISNVEVSPYGSSLGKRSGVNGSMSLTVLASERLQLTAFANRAFNSTLTSNSAYELSQGYGLTANYAVSDRLRLRAGGQIAPRSFYYAITPTGPFIGKQTQYDIFGGATYALNRRLRFNLDAGAQRRDTDIGLFDYHGWYAAAGLSISL